MPDPCPCGSARLYAQCCGRYIEQGVAAPSAEALMRSRYSAYAKGKIDYLRKTMHAQMRDGKSDAAMLDWIAEATFEKLVILNVRRGKALDKKGEVDFCAWCHRGDNRECHREHAYFEKIKGRWLYTGATFEGIAPCTEA